MGSIMATVAVLEIHMDRKAVVDMNPSMIILGEVPSNSRIWKKIKFFSILNSLLINYQKKFCTSLSLSFALFLSFYFSFFLSFFLSFYVFPALSILLCLSVSLFLFISLSTPVCLFVSFFPFSMEKYYSNLIWLYMDDPFIQGQILKLKALIIVFILFLTFTHI